MVVKQRGLKKLTQSGAFYTFLTFIAVATLFPVLLMMSTSLKQIQSVFEIPFRWIPDPVQWSNYVTIFERYQFFRFFLNSLFVASVTAAVNLFLSSMAGFGIAKYRFPARGVILAFVIVTLLLPRQALVVPLFLVVRSFGLVDSLWAVILPFAATPFGIFLMTQYMRTVPDSLLESPRIDGATEFLTFRKIVVPMVTPAFAALGIFAFTFNWNNFLWPLVILRSEENFTMPLGISLMQGAYATSYNLLLAAAAVSALPILVVYVFLQRFFISSVALSGLKE